MKQGNNKTASNKVWGGAAKLGLGMGSVGLIVALLKDEALRRKAEKNDHSDTMVIRRDSFEKSPVVKLAAHNKNAFLTKALIAAGITGSTLIAIDRMVGHLQKKRLKKDIEELDKVYDAGLGSLKTAGMAFDLAVNLPTELLILSMLAGGAATYATLEKSFPKKKFKNLNKGKYPRKVVIEGYGSLAPDGKADGPLVDENDKSASFEVDEGDALRAASLAYAALADSRISEGDQSPLADIAVGLPKLKMASDVAVDAILDSPDYGAAWASMSNSQKLSAASSALSDPELGPSARLIFQSEFFSQQPELAKAATAWGCHEELYPLTLKLASCLANNDFLLSASN